MRPVFAGQVSFTVQPSMKLPQAPYWPNAPNLYCVAQLKACEKPGVPPFDYVTFGSSADAVAATVPNAARLRARRGSCAREVPFVLGGRRHHRGCRAPACTLLGLVVTTPAARNGVARPRRA